MIYSKEKPAQDTQMFHGEKIDAARTADLAVQLGMPAVNHEVETADFTPVSLEEGAVEQPFITDMPEHLKPATRIEVQGDEPTRMGEPIVVGRVSNPTAVLGHPANPNSDELQAYGRHIAEQAPPQE
jgi:hypothetical protein